MCGSSDDGDDIVEERRRIADEGTKSAVQQLRERGRAERFACWVNQSIDAIRSREIICCCDYYDNNRWYCMNIPFSQKEKIKYKKRRLSSSIQIRTKQVIQYCNNYD